MAPALPSLGLLSTLHKNKCRPRSVSRPALWSQFRSVGLLLLVFFVLFLLAFLLSLLFAFLVVDLLADQLAVFCDLDFPVLAVHHRVGFVDGLAILGFLVDGFDPGVVAL